jgi:hypothetical protein
MQIVRIDNKGNEPLVLINNGDKYTIPFNGSKMVPFECAASAFGDPRARDTGRDRGRSDTYDHIRACWNFYLGFDDAGTWEQKRPKFEAYDVNTGDRVWFVIDDPKGDQTFNAEVVVAETLVNTDRVLLTSQLKELQEQVAVLAAALAANQDRDPAGFKAPEIVPVEDHVATEPIANATELPAMGAATPVKSDGPRRAK